MKKIVFLFAAAALVMGCSEPEKKIPHSFGKYETPFEFILPNENLIKYSNPEKWTLQKPKAPWEYSAEKRENGKWQVWVLTNYWSDHDEGATKSFRTRSGEASRLTAGLVDRIGLFQRHSDLPFEVNVVAYGLIPQLKITAPNHPSQGTLAGDACGGGFRRCADNFYLAPAARFKSDIQGRSGVVSWFDFASHVMQLTVPADTTERGRMYFEMKRKQWLDGGETDERLNLSPDMVFIVSPDGKAHYGWTSYGMSRTASDRTVMYALIEIFGKQDDQKIVGHWNQISRDYYAARESWHGLHAGDVAAAKLGQSIENLANFVMSGGQQRQ